MKTFLHTLRKIGNDSPPMIHCMGNLSLLADAANRIAIIGARAASSTWLGKAYELGTRFTEEGNIIVNGLALGCDKAAHEGCLDAGVQTIVIVASWLDIVHPKENASLQQRILENGGLILSEQPFGVKANPTRLVARNRLQAALSNIVILAECPQQSGGMHTIRFARKYHKRCLVVAYPEYNEKNAGNELLINLNLSNAIWVMKKILINPFVKCGDLNNVPDYARQHTYGFFGALPEQERSYELFQTVYPKVAWFVNAHNLSLIDIKDIIHGIINSIIWLSKMLSKAIFQKGNWHW